MRGGPRRMRGRGWALATAAIAAGVLVLALLPGTTWAWLSGTRDAPLSITTADEFTSPTPPAIATATLPVAPTPPPCDARTHRDDACTQTPRPTPTATPAATAIATLTATPARRPCDDDCMRPPRPTRTATPTATPDPWATPTQKPCHEFGDWDIDRCTPTPPPTPTSTAGITPAATSSPTATPTQQPCDDDSHGDDGPCAPAHRQAEEATAAVMATAAPTPATVTPTPTVAATAAATPTPTATPPAICEPSPGARLAFRSDEIDLRGFGPLGTSIVITNDGTSGPASDPLLVLRTADGAGYIQSVEFANGQVWAVDGQPSATLYLVGGVPEGGTVRIPVMVDMTASWRNASPGAAATMLVGITSVQCGRSMSSARLTISMEPGF